MDDHAWMPPWKRVSCPISIFTRGAGDHSRLGLADGDASGTLLRRPRLPLGAPDPIAPSKTAQARRFRRVVREVDSEQVHPARRGRRFSFSEAGAVQRPVLAAEIRGEGCVCKVAPAAGSGDSGVGFLRLGRRRGDRTGGRAPRLGAAPGPPEARAAGGRPSAGAGARERARASRRAPPLARAHWPSPRNRLGRRRGGAGRGGVGLTPSVARPSVRPSARPREEPRGTLPARSPARPRLLER